MILGAEAKANSATVEDATQCFSGTLDPKKVNGTILVYLRFYHTISPEMGEWAAEIGTAGIILANNKTLDNAIHLDVDVIPFLISISLMLKLTSVASISDLEAYFNLNSAPAMGTFSGRGPNPDVTAPEVNILPAYNEAIPPSYLISNNRRNPFNIMSITSMSCPHVSSIVGLLKTLYPNWTSSGDNSTHPIIDDNNVDATQFVYDYICAYGYNESFLRAFTISEKTYSCPQVSNMANFNYPSVVVSYVNGSTSITQHHKNVGLLGIYKARVKAPAGFSVFIEPNSLKFEKYGKDKKFEAEFVGQGNVSFKGICVWGSDMVRW
ncbi:hypothetical protein Patl1_05928 [Pistacia atlantica]|uniref:Uncharacterized protein n=1 Tax=Pistacia atlantica TaxID=434234 RepID=A0ACC1BUC7_9ROSI|nr:hypothetical protein Patl1_05928 [Pistacia atlantica]